MNTFCEPQNVFLAGVIPEFFYVIETRIMMQRKKKRKYACVLWFTSVLYWITAYLLCTNTCSQWSHFYWNSLTIPELFAMSTNGNLCVLCRKFFDHVKCSAQCTTRFSNFHNKCVNVDQSSFHTKKSSWRCKKCNESAFEKNKLAKNFIFLYLVPLLLATNASVEGLK